jgi:hypothetical protein
MLLHCTAREDLIAMLAFFRKFQGGVYDEQLLVFVWLE